MYRGNRWTAQMAQDAFEEEAHPRDESGKFGSGGGHGIQKVTPTEHGAKYTFSDHPKSVHHLEVTRRGGFVSHHQEGMHGPLEQRTSKSVFPQVHAAVKAHLAEHGPHPEAGGEKKIAGGSSIGKQVRLNAARARGIRRAGF